MTAPQRARAARAPELSRDQSTLHVRRERAERRTHQWPLPANGEPAERRTHQWPLPANGEPAERRTHQWPLPANGEPAERRTHLGPLPEDGGERGDTSTDHVSLTVRGARGKRA